MSARVGRVMRRVARAVAVAALVLAPDALAAQLRPHADWRTLATEHFRVHFTPATEEQARRAAAAAERAWALLADELAAPRGPVDLVLSDDVDFSNGYATPFPSNRIVVYAQPPVASASLRFYEDWTTLVVTHELAHIFHLDRSRGWWRAAQYVFGRNPALFPNLYTPAWVKEGLAVHYESKLTGAGRLHGRQFHMYAQAARLAGHLPRLDELSLATSQFPGGETSYAYGSLLMDRLANASGGMRGFVDATAGTVIPFRLNHNAKRGFGTSFGDAWTRWRDSLPAPSAGGSTLPGVGRTLARGAWALEYPRWMNDSLLLVAGNDGRDVPGAYLVAPGRAPERVGRRNGVDRNVPLADGGVLYAQLDYTDPYTVRSDLWVQRGGTERRLTAGARLTTPDARARDGAIVAVQSVPGTTRLVRVSADGQRIVPLAPASLDAQWSEPRWSPEGDRIAAVRLRRGAVSELVVLDTLGAELRVVAAARAVSAAPAWTPDGRRLVFASDVGGQPEIYELSLDSPDATPRRVAATATGFFQPDVSPTGGALAAVRYENDGYALAVTPLASDLAVAADLPWPHVEHGASAAAETAAPSEQGTAGRYSPWRSLMPRYWSPMLLAGEGDDLLLGGFTSGADVVGRHSYAAQALVNLSNGQASYDAHYRYAGLGQPLLDVGLAEFWDDMVLARESGEVAGELRERTRLLSLAASLSRPRARSSAYASLAGEVEQRRYTTRPAPLLDSIAARFGRGATEPAVRLSAGWSNTRHPMRSVSAEDGVSVSASARQRWLADDVSALTRSAQASLSAYKSLPVGRGAHHVLALRVAGGWADDAATSSFEAGGVNGGALEIVPGVVLGEGAHTFGVRGFASEAQEGNRAATATLEYRAPLGYPTRGAGLFPAFLDRTALALFAEGGSAWCSEAAAAGRRIACTGGASDPRWLASVGAELSLDAAVLEWDSTYRFRVGVAAPVRGRELTGADAASVYVTVGRAF
ncbi:MAG TPA: hypothetical protein VHQ45_10775 [Gemmatimonadaceae bacterium]|nr:hypothetical protein [Gemmatimonadaceae bacterium]